uniref:Uncharacterized protein n=1 Tax=Arundo donax TaxID=35708 RepID=A0A0A9BZF9_ARUDO
MFESDEWSKFSTEFMVVSALTVCRLMRFPIHVPHYLCSGFKLHVRLQIIDVFFGHIHYYLRSRK